MKSQLEARDPRTRSYYVVNKFGDSCPGHPEKFFHVPPRSSDEPTLLERYRAVNLGLYLVVRPVPAYTCARSPRLLPSGSGLGRRTALRPLHVRSMC